MSLRLVRCPFCASRFNVTGILPGTLLRCANCTAVLSVPGSETRPRASLRMSRKALLLTASAAALVVLAGAGTYWLFAPTPAASEPDVAIGTPVPPPAPETSRGPVSVGVDMVQAQQAILDEFGTGFILHALIKPYLVALEPSQRYVETDVIEEYARRLATLQATFHHEIGSALGLPEVDGVLPVIVLNSRQSFDKYCEAKEKKRMPAAVKGFYDSQRRRVIVYHDFNVSHEVLFHEGAHQLVHYYTLRQTDGRPTSSTYWFAEGMGTYFEGFRRREDGRFVFDTSANSGRLSTLRQSLAQRGMKDFIPLSLLMDMSVDQFWDWYEKSQGVDPDDATRRAQLYYAESWALVRFLRQKSPAHRELFQEFFRAELAGRAGKQVVESFLRDRLGQELSDLDRDFAEYILEMR
jgi:hypothetical protein